MTKGGAETDLDPRGASVAPPPGVGFALELVDGEAARVESGGEPLTIGSHEAASLVVDDRLVSRFHCEVRVEEGRARLRDLESRNGTLLDGVPIVEAFPRDGSVIRAGDTSVRFSTLAAAPPPPVSSADRFGSLLGRSASMRSVFALLERTAPRDVTVLVEGETGTGKEEAARSIHDASPRADGPFVVVDCSALTTTHVEERLFGDERAGTAGAFEQAHGGTLFLDEVGDLAAEQQPKLLRALESGAVRRIGGASPIDVDARVIAATHRDLRADVNARRFREDLYYRLAVVCVRMPPLRERPEDIPLLVDAFARAMGASEDALAVLASDETLLQLGRAAWPGNVRQLRNWVEHFVVVERPAPLTELTASTAGLEVDARVPWAQARRHAIDEFERRYLAALLDAHDGNVSRAAEAAGVSRVYLHQMLRKHR